MAKLEPKPGMGNAPTRMDKDRRCNSALLREEAAAAFTGALVVARRRPLRLSASSRRGYNSVGIMIAETGCHPEMSVPTQH